MSNYTRGIISLEWWGDSHKDLDYRYLPHKDERMVSDWNAQGYSHMHCNGAVYGMDRGMPDWALQFRSWFPWANSGIAVYRMNTGDILPVHSDHYTSYKKIFNILSNDEISRAVRFLENWKSGHYFEIDGVPITNWTKGEYIFWEGDTPHMAANMGIEPRYTMQITGMKNESK